MAITKNTARQWPLAAVVDIAFGDTPTTATFYEAVDLPGKARVYGGVLVVKTAWDSTTNTFAVGDSGTGARYLAASDLKTVGSYPFDLTAEDGSAPLDIGVTYTETGAAAGAGAAQLIVLYTLDDRSNEVQPTVD